MRLEELKGLGKARVEALNKAGVHTLQDLLLMLPSSYQDTTVSTPIAQLVPGEVCCVEGYVINSPKLARFKGRSSVTVRIRDDSVPRGSLNVVFFNQPWVPNQIHENDQVVFYGRVDRDKAGKTRMYCPARVTERGIVPVYRAVSAIPGKTMRDIIRQGLEQLESCCPETLPRDVRLRYGLCERNFALRQAHFPETKENLSIALRRIAFEEALFYQTASLLLRGERTNGVKMQFAQDTPDAFWNSLPFAPTGAQRRVLVDIAEDLTKDAAMGRIVQGDVGCGKTAVAFGAMYCACKSGYQSALMAPTEILARQHLESARKMLEPLGIRCGLLLSGMKTKERREALESIRTGSWQVVIGTHALLSEGVEYADLGLVITDEQHRFGVHQRKMLSNKGKQTPNALVMSATPIPRTLALVLYGDLDISVIDQLPPGRTPVTTRVVPEEKRQGLYGFIRDEAKKGRQTYIVCPMVHENENLDVKSAQETYAELSMGALADLRLGLTYGEQPADEKEETLKKFSAGDMDVLVATTVIEVGVNVPSATVMVIENAERFGLSQLHQLRGRVGRGAEKSWCFLLAQPNERLKTLCETGDGFVIARKDLELRGPGDFLGKRQHGDSMMPGLAMGGDSKLLEESSRCLRELQQKGMEEAWDEVKRNARAAFARVMDEIAMN